MLDCNGKIQPSFLRNDFLLQNWVALRVLSQVIFARGHSLSPLGLHVCCENRSLFPLLPISARGPQSTPASRRPSRSFSSSQVDCRVEMGWLIYTFHHWAHYWQNHYSSKVKELGPIFEIQICYFCTSCTVLL